MNNSAGYGLELGAEVISPHAEDYSRFESDALHQSDPNRGEQIMQVGPAVKGSGDEDKNSRPAHQAGDAHG